MQAFGNFGTRAFFQTVFLEDLTDKKAHVLIERCRLIFPWINPRGIMAISVIRMSNGYLHTKRRENAASRSIPRVVTSMPAKGIKIRLQSREPRHPPMRSAEYSDEITFFWSLIS
jgi:hypothetical protein